MALIGPGAVALLWKRSIPNRNSVRTSLPWLTAFAFLVVSVAAIARYGEMLSWADVGFGRMSWVSAPSAVVLGLFFIFVFGPLASRVLLWLDQGSFDGGKQSLAMLPRWYLFLTIVIVGGGEEWLYRGYAIERLQALIGDIWLAGLVSLVAFGLAHLPLWGIGPSLTTIFSGGILTALYIWQRDISFLIMAHVATDLYGLLYVPSLRQSKPT
jgi:membrane protease YdiL (CAAX protease family)